MKFCVLLILCLLTGCANAHPAGIREYALRLDLANGVCSATAVGPRLLLTATHCMEANRIVLIDGKPAHALKRVDDGKDHSLVRVSVRFKRWAKLGQSPVSGDHVRWVGNPAGNENVYREGYVARSYSDEVWLDAQAFGGDSGSGVFGADGRICGVISAGKVWARGSFLFAVAVMYPVKFTDAQWKEMA